MFINQKADMIVLHKTPTQEMKNLSSQAFQTSAIPTPALSVAVFFRRFCGKDLKIYIYPHLPRLQTPHRPLQDTGHPTGPDQIAQILQSPNYFCVCHQQTACLRRDTFMRLNPCEHLPMCFGMQFFFSRDLLCRYRDGSSPGPIPSGSKPDRREVFDVCLAGWCFPGSFMTTDNSKGCIVPAASPCCRSSPDSSTGVMFQCASKSG